MESFFLPFIKKNEYLSYLIATVVAAMVAAVGLAINEIIFVIASMLIAPVLANIESSLGEKKYIMNQEMKTKVEKTHKPTLRAFLDIPHKPRPEIRTKVGKTLYYFVYGNNIFRFLVTIILIILFSWVFGIVASSLNLIDLSAYFATNSQGELIREGSPSNQLASRINISETVYFASIFATALGGILLSVTYYHAKKGITDQIIGVAIAASFAPPASALGLALTLNNIWEPSVWQLGALTANFLVANIAAFYLGLFTAKLLFRTRRKDEIKKKDDLRDISPDISYVLFSSVILILTIATFFVAFY